MKMNENKIEKSIENQNNNNKGVNNNHEDFKMEIKLNSENDPLTGSKILKQKPSAIQRFRHRIATPNIFMAVFLLAYIFQGTYFTYFVSVMTTIEKVFHISSSWIAIMLNFSEVGQICTSLTLTYYAGRGHRPRLIAIGTMIFSIAAFVSLLPHFIFYSSLYKTDLTTTTNSSISNVAFNSNQTSEISVVQWGQCLEEDKYRNLSIHDNDCSTNFENSSQQPSLNTKIQSIVFVTFSVSLLFIGIGQTALATLGIPYIDDNVKSAQSAAYIAITIGVRILGPLLGYYLGSYCTTISVDLSQNVNTIDNNFIGAWWLGMIIVAGCMFLTSCIMFMFPKNLHNNSSKVSPVDNIEEMTEMTEKNHEVEKLRKDEENPKLETNDYDDKNELFIPTIKRHITNKVFMLRTFSAVFHLLPITGLYVFLPRYLETQFLMPANQASFFAGTFGILAMGVGISLAGIISAKYQTTPKQFAKWVVVSTFLTIVGFGILMLVGCSMDNYKGLAEKSDSDGLIFKNREFKPLCSAFNSTCYCDYSKFAPLCGTDGNIYYSACHAGCKLKTLDQESKTFYSQCECLPDIEEDFKAESTTCNTGRCNTQLVIFIAVFAFTVFIHASSEVGRMIIIMRCVPAKDKTMAMGIVQFSLGVFSNIPCANIYAAIVNASCIVWMNVCGEGGYCSLYDSDNFRVSFFGLSGLILSLALAMDILILRDSDVIDNKSDAIKNENNLENLLKTRKGSADIPNVDDIPKK